MKLRARKFNSHEKTLTFYLMPNSEGGTRNAYLGVYDEEDHFLGSLCGPELARLAKALEPYKTADLEPALRRRSA